MFRKLKGLIGKPRDCKLYQIVPISEVPRAGPWSSTIESEGWFGIEYRGHDGLLRRALMSPAEYSHSYIIRYIKRHNIPPRGG